LFIRYREKKRKRGGKDKEERRKTVYGKRYTVNDIKGEKCKKK
jgi:hypothetical protein